jgi:uncharacterized protein (TIGR02246 family)
MGDPNSEREIRQYFDRFVEAFATFDGEQVAGLFAAPGVALKRDGSLQGFASASDIQAYYQAALDHYRASGCNRCRYMDLESVFLNDASAIATASWDLLHEDGSIIAHWRQAYFLSRSDDEWRAYGSAFVSQ